MICFSRSDNYGMIRNTKSNSKSSKTRGSDNKATLCKNRYFLRFGTPPQFNTTVINTNPESVTVSSNVGTYQVICYYFGCSYLVTTTKTHHIITMLCWSNAVMLPSRCSYTVQKQVIGETPFTLLQDTQPSKLFRRCYFKFKKSYIMLL